MRTYAPVLAIVLSVLVAVPQLHAQAPHVASPSAVAAALDEHRASQASAREDVLRVLGHAQVKALADHVGIDLKRAATAVSLLDGQDLAAVSGQARHAEAALSGGQSSVTISTTMIIIGLLVLILLIVALN